MSPVHGHEEVIGAHSFAEPPACSEPERRGVYIASRTRHAPKWLELRADGFPIISSWIDEAGAGQTADWQDLWDRCIAEASGAAAMIVYADADDAYLRGAIAEVGAALSHGVPVYVVMADRNLIGSAWRHRLVTECDTLEDAMALALARTVRKPTGRGSASERPTPETET